MVEVLERCPRIAESGRGKFQIEFQIYNGLTYNNTTSKPVVGSAVESQLTFGASWIAASSAARRDKASLSHITSPHQKAQHASQDITSSAGSPTALVNILLFNPHPCDRRKYPPSFKPSTSPGAPKSRPKHRRLSSPRTSSASLPRLPRRFPSSPRSTSIVRRHSIRTAPIPMFPRSAESACRGSPGETGGDTGAKRAFAEAESAGCGCQWG